MAVLESIKNTFRRWVTSLPFFVLLGLVLGTIIAVQLIPRPKVAIIPISGAILEQSFADNILEALKRAEDDNSVRAVVLQIASPGGGSSVIEQVYLDVLQLRKKKPVVASIGSIAASGGYYIAAASERIYAPPTSIVGSIGVIGNLPSPEGINEQTVTSGLFKATGSSKRHSLAELEMVRQQFVSEVISQRGERLKLLPEEISLAMVYSGSEALKLGLIDEIGTITSATRKAASLAGIRNYTVEEIPVQQTFSFLFFGPADMQKLISQNSTTPTYYYLAFESE
ncbi:MAG: S49 family peptidase [Chloroflexi bacterium]|nr:S49 family peptidase [Chloroflexota bacterium]